MFDLIRQIISDMCSHKMRSVLALFGIVWGTVAVVVLLALGQGFYNAGKKNMEKISAGYIVGIPSRTSLPYRGLPQGQPLHLNAAAVMSLKDAVPHIQYVTPSLKEKAVISYQEKIATQSVSGVSSSYDKINKKNVMPGGRFLNISDVTAHRRVAVLGDGLAENLFAKIDPIGKSVQINGVPFTVIGVFEESNNDISFGGGRASLSLYVPYTTFIGFWGDIDSKYFSVVPDSLHQMNNVKQGIVRYFAGRYHFDPSDEMAINLPDVNQFAVFFEMFFRGVQIFLGFCGAMTLGVGGVGVANIMFLVITERTREIGLRMALGAKDSQILFQILLESFVIVTLGAAGGLLLSVLIVSSLQSVHLPAWMGIPVISYSSLGLTTFVLALLALLAGFFPARKASRLDPVVALSS